MYVLESRGATDCANCSWAWFAVDGDSVNAMFLSHRGRRASRRFVSLVITLNLLFALIFEACAVGSSQKQAAQEVVYEDNEFAEFEEFDEEDEAVPKTTAAPTAAPSAQSAKSVDTSQEEDEEAVVEEDDDELFEGGESREEPKGKKAPLKITAVPLHLRNNWENYYLEILMCLGIVVYFINFITGRSKNQHLADAWLAANRELLEEQFALVGDDGKKDIENYGLIKDSENVFVLWCSGRQSVEGMLVELRLLKRHDLVSAISRYFKHVQDQIVSQTDV